MKFICLLALPLLLHSVNLSAQSFTVRSHDHVNMGWYGSYDQWAVFPDASQNFRKIVLHYDMGCATGGCSPWDYTTQVQLRHRTGLLDSNLAQQPTFTVNGNVITTYSFNTDTTFTTFFDSLTLSTDSNANNATTIIVYSDPVNPTTATDTIYGWPVNYWNYDYDNLGMAVDSHFVAADSTWTVGYLPYYSIFEIIHTYELARVITPYGGNLPSSYSFTHDFDVTDFEQLLRDSVEIRVFYSGWSSGFSATLDFEFFPGIPPRNVVNIQSVYRGDFGYSNSANFETNVLYPKTFYVSPDAGMAKIRMTTTGHGFDNNINAAEFFPIYYYVKVNGNQTHSQYNWRDDCGENPIYPDYETGTSYVHTWLYDRANWCPGLKAHIYEHEITGQIVPGDSVTIDVDFQNYSWSGAQGPSYTIDCQLVQYEAPNFTNDIELLEIIAPSKKDEYSRLNPVCRNPVVVLRNYGSSTITSCIIQYNIEGGPVQTFNWSGSLDFMDTVSVTLPLTNIAAFWNGSGNPVFHASVSNPNGSTDQYFANNALTSTFGMVPTYPSDFIVNFRTNLDGAESAWTIKDGIGNIVAQRSNMNNNTTYNDTISLADGCYEFEVTDSGEDGLYFYFNNSGTGFCRLKNIGPGYFRVFKPNFGSKYSEQFKVGYQFGIEQNEFVQDVLIYPNPSQGIVHINLAGFAKGNTRIELINFQGRMIRTVEFNADHDEHLITLDLSNEADGMYFVRIRNGETIVSKKIMLTR